MPYKAREVRRALSSKLGLELATGHRHPIFAFWHEGEVVAKTHMSHGTRDVSDGVISAMARQLRITAPQLRGSIDCRVSPEAFAELVLEAAEAE